MHKNELKHESNQATLAHVKKEMDEPRIVESAREEAIHKTPLQNLEAAIIQHGPESGAVQLPADAPEGEE